MSPTVPRWCCQELSGGVLLDTFPWNNDVVVVDNESPAADFSLQPPQDVVKYGAGIVMVQTTWGSHPTPRMCWCGAGRDREGEAEARGRSLVELPQVQQVGGEGEWYERMRDRDVSLIVLIANVRSSTYLVYSIETHILCIRYMCDMYRYRGRQQF